MVKNGYKQTEFGVIPEDWEIKRFSQLFTIGHGKDQKTIETKDGKYPILATSGIVGYTNSYLWDKSSALIGRKGTINKPQYIETPFWTIDTLFYTKIFDDVFPKYIYYLFCTIDWLSLNEASGVPSLSANNIEKISYAIPSFEEQNLISEALSDVDNIIISLEKLIAKKEAIKQGAMQELLTGRKRLPGFSGEWLEKKVEDIITRFATGLNPRQNFKLNNGGTNYYVTIKDFREGKLFLDDDCDRIDDVALKRINERSDLQKDDLLFSSIGRIGDAYLITETPKNWNINESVFALRPNQQVICTLMLYYLLTSEEVKNKLLDNTTGSTLKSIKLGHLKEIPCRFPKDINEQTAIASILSDMDSEIEALEEKLKKARQVKQGMMQELLTGRIRLV